MTKDKADHRSLNAGEMNKAKSSQALLPAKQRRVVESLRREITAGNMVPGTRLPTREKLREMFDASTDTVQRSMNRLCNDGFIESKGTLGTFVAQSPPHLCHYGLVIPCRPTTGAPLSRFYVAMREAIAAVQGSSDRKVTCYYADEHRQHGTGQDELYRDVVSHRLAGLIFADNPFRLTGTPAMDPDNGIPKIAIMAGREAEYVNIPAIYPSHESFLDRALDYAKERGRKRVGFLSMLAGTDLQAFISAGLKKRGLTSQRYWDLRFHPDLPATARTTTQLLMRWNRLETPDALIIADDNLIEPVVAGLIESGVRAPQDVELISYCNFPSIVKTALPVKRFGCDCIELMRRCTEILQQQQLGKRIAPMTWLFAKADDEF